jgi:hypothetical protein
VNRPIFLDTKRRRIQDARILLGIVVSTGITAALIGTALFLGIGALMSSL